ncbi:scavenger receptor class F member 2-like [Mizuhopecten yessoensis]|uniref:scavenger receptor class F member 2-like n=1 Tax=Mizuhopecten yessoensis TaxID=6573 RepID=UPI000B45A52E|nr:scavenger receptor class F member 2-like [Mizuhopecten yessoensis]
MEVCPVWLAILFFIASVQIVNTSVNTSLDSKVKTSQSSDTDVAYTSDEVVDNCTTQKLDSACCSHTNSNPTPNEAWWQIDLGDQVVIEYIQIYYRDEGPFQTARFAGYQIYLSNTTGWRNSDSCYNDATSTQCMVDLTPRITTCTGNNRYLTIYVDRQTKSNNWYSTQAILELCEVQVYGCPVRKYGISNCDSNCDTTCVNSLCHPNSGQCTYCAPGFYKSGLVCTACPTKCLNDLCNVESGVCSACANGYHGSQCDQSCSNNCQDKICDQYSSVCTGCVDRFFGPLCVACSPNCVDPVCDKSSGNCIQCLAGYHGSTCTQTCPTNCKDNICIQDNRFCIGCEQEFHGSTCQQRCPIACKDNTCSQFSGQCEGYTYFIFTIVHFRGKK